MRLVAGRSSVFDSRKGEKGGRYWGIALTTGTGEKLRAFLVPAGGERGGDYSSRRIMAGRGEGKSLCIREQGPDFRENCTSKVVERVPFLGGVFRT